MLCQRQVSKAGKSNYIPLIAFNVFACLCPWCMLLAQNSSVSFSIIFCRWPFATLFRAPATPFMSKVDSNLADPYYGWPDANPYFSQRGISTTKYRPSRKKTDPIWYTLHYTTTKHLSAVSVTRPLLMWPVCAHVKRTSTSVGLGLYPLYSQT